MILMFTLAPKLSYNLPCDPNNQCDNTIGLSCQSSVCECNSPTSAWNLTNCSKSFHIFMKPITYLSNFC